VSYTPPTGAGNVTSSTATSGATLSTNKPSNLANGDLLVISGYKQTNGTYTTPSGFTLLYKAAATSTRGLAVYAKAITNASGEASTYSIVTSESTSRWGMTAFRLPGMASTYLDAAPSSDIYYSSTVSSIVDPAVTAVSSTTLALSFNFTNNSTAVYQTFTSSGWATLSNVQVTSGASTSVLDVSYKELTSAGTTGSTTFALSPAAASGGGFQLTLALQPQNFSSSPALSGSGTLTASGTAPGSSSPALSGDGTLTTGATVATTGTAGLSGSGLLQAVGARGGTTLDTWLAKPGPKYCAHRGGFYATYGEFTVAGFQALTAWNPNVAWNIDVYNTSDGEWVASHDQTTGRVLSGTSLDIPTNTWSSISSKTTLVGGNPVARLDDLVSIAPAGTVFFIDNKRNTNTTAFFAKLTALGLSPSNVVNKNYIGSNGMMTAARTAGYTTWAYGFDTDMTAFASNHGNADWLGFDYAGTQANWNTVIGYGQPSFAHILASTANKTTADTLANTAGGTNFGYMVSNVAAVIAPGSTPALSGSGTLTAAGTPATGQAATLTGSGSLILTGQPAFGSTATLSGSGTLAATGQPGVLSTVALAGAGSLSASSGGAAVGPAVLTGSGTLGAEASAPTLTQTVDLAGSGDLTADAVLAFGTDATLSGTGVLTTAAFLAAAEAVGLTGSGTLTAVGVAGGAARNVTFTGRVTGRTIVGRVED
jgi:fibronectin-binding autotransporter adhesin